MGCSSSKENCMATKCCNVAGYYCYEKNDTFAQCAKTCSPSASNLCRPASETLQLEPDYSTPKRSLFCFSVYTENTGSPKPSYELDLFAEICMSKNGVHYVEAFDVSTDGACEANRPLDQKKNKKWHSDCKVKTAAMHPFKKPKDWFDCFDQTMAM